MLRVRRDSILDTGLHARFCKCDCFRVAPVDILRVTHAATGLPLPLHPAAAGGNGPNVLNVRDGLR